MKISTILDKIDENQIFVPAFQREYVWKRDDAKQLIDSLIKEYPTGTMLTWETANPPELKGPYKYNEKQGAVRLLGERLESRWKICSVGGWSGRLPIFHPDGAIEPCPSISNSWN